MNRQHSRRLVVEFLEDRTLLSSSPLAPDAAAPLGQPADAGMVTSRTDYVVTGPFRQASPEGQADVAALLAANADGTVSVPSALPSQFSSGSSGLEANPSLPASALFQGDHSSAGDFTRAIAVNCAPAVPVFASALPVVELHSLDLRPSLGLRDQPFRSFDNGGYEVKWYVPAEVFTFVVSVANRLEDSAAPAASAPLVSQILATAPAIAHAMNRVAALLDTAGSNLRGVDSTPAVATVQAGQVEQAATEATSVRSEAIFKEPSSPAGQIPSQGLLAQGELVAGPLNSALMRLRAGNREVSSWVVLVERGTGSVPSWGRAVAGVASTLPSPVRHAGEPLAPALPDLVEIVSLSSKAAVALETGLPLNVLLLRQEVDTFFAHLGSHPEAAPGLRSYLRLAPWLALLGGAAAFEFTRRWNKKSSRRTASEEEAVFGPVAFLPEDRQ
jgi:hypothetical protein